MRKLFTTVMAALMALSVWAEAPQTISYQAVVRNNVGRLHRDKPVGVRITILSGSEDGQVVYSETRTATTNNNGLLTFAIGDANAESSYDLSKIAWAENTYYLRCEMDPDGGNSYTLSSTSQMNSVPYALYAKNIAPEALPTWAQSEEKPVYNYTEIQGAPSVPTKVSELQNDANYITLQQVPTVVVPTKVSELQNDANYLSEHQSLADYAKKSELPSTAGLLSEADAAATYQPKGEYLTEHQSLADYAKKSELPAVPTKVSQLSNDAGYITEANVTTTLNTINVSELVNDANYATTADVPTKVSQLTNDKGYITAEDVPAVSVPTKVSAFENDKNYLTEHQSLADYAKKSELPSTAGLLREADAAATYQPKGEYLTEHQSLADYAKKSELPAVPTKVSQLTNDAGYVTESNMTTVLNTTNVSELVNDANYATTADVPTKVSQLTNDKGYITAAEVPAVTVPTKVSAFENDKNYLTEHQSLADYAKKSELPAVPTKVSELTNDANYVTEGNITTVLNTTNVSELVNDANYATTADVPTKVSQLTNDKGYITAADVPAVSVPTKVSAFENDVNYLTEHQSLAEYAKKSELPSVPTKVSELTNDANYVTEGNITTVLNTTNVSELVNDANYATTADVPTKVSQLTNDKGYITAADVPAVSVPTKVSAFENDANYLTEHQSLADYAKKSELPTVPTKVSQLTNDANYVTEGNITTTLNTINVSELVNDANYATTADVPTKVSQLTNDKGYITAADVPAVSVPTKVSAFENDAKYVRKSELPSKVSDLVNDRNFVTEDDIPEIPKRMSQLENDSKYVTKSDIPTKNSEIINDRGFITIDDVPVIPTKVSAFENDAKYITKADFDLVVANYDALLQRYTKKMDSVMTVLDSAGIGSASGGSKRTVKITDGALPGLFSVAADKQVKFSMGNLQYQASTNTWRFAENQNDYVGNLNTSISSTNEGWIDLFGWGTSGYHNVSDTDNKNYMPYSTSSSSIINSTNNYYGYGPSLDQTDKNLVGTSAKYDWGVYNAITNGGNEDGIWRTLTYDEWDYLYSRRERANRLRVMARIEGIAGLVLFPDGWTQSETISIYWEANSYDNNMFTRKVWNELEAQGAVFLPAAGYRSGTSVSYVGSGRYYWSSTYVDNKTARGLGNDNSYNNRYTGRSVRLVQDTTLIQYTVELNVTPVWSGQVSGNGAHDKGASVSISATPATGYAFKSWSDGNTEASRTIILREDITLTAIFEAELQNVAVEGVLPGKFSISAKKQVNFSMGNLQYQASTGIWRFSENQYDVIGADNKNISSTYSGWIDLFGWGTSGYNNKHPYIANSSSSWYGDGTQDITGTNYDWGVYNAISNGGNKACMWRTLTTSEWFYILNTRANAKNLRGTATVNGKHGYVLLPDDWRTPSDLIFIAEPKDYTTNRYSTYEWNRMEAAGALFLPFAGVRDNRYGVGISSDGSNHYWSSTADGTNNAYNVDFYNYDAYTTVLGRQYGFSVRLVRETTE